MRQEARSSVQHRLSNSSVGGHFVEDAGGVGGQDVGLPHLHDPPLRKHHDSVARHDRRKPMRDRQHRARFKLRTVNVISRNLSQTVLVERGRALQTVLVVARPLERKLKCQVSHVAADPSLTSQLVGVAAWRLSALCHLHILQTSYKL